MTAVAVEVEVVVEPDYADINFHSTESVRLELGISDRTMRTYARLLRRTLTKQEFDYRPYEPAVSEQSRKALLKFQQLQSQIGREKALKILKIQGV